MTEALITEALRAYIHRNRPLLKGVGHFKYNSERCNTVCVANVHARSRKSFWLAMCAVDSEYYCFRLWTILNFSLFFSVHVWMFASHLTCTSTGVNCSNNYIDVISRLTNTLPACAGGRSDAVTINAAEPMAQSLIMRPVKSMSSKCYHFNWYSVNDCWRNY